MNILQIYPFYPPHLGGAEISIKELSENLVKLGNNVIVLTLRTDSSLPFIRNENGVIVYRIPGLTFESIPFEVDFSLPFILYIIKKHKIDIINTNLVYFPNSLMSYFSKKFHSVPIILTERTGRLNSNSKITLAISRIYLKTFIKRFITRFNGYIALNKEIKHFLLGLDIPSFKIKVIPNGININKFFPDPSVKDKYFKTFGFSDDTIIITSIGRLLKVKGIEYFIKSIPNIIHDNPSKKIKFLIVGNGPEINNFKKLIRILSLDQYIYLLGHRDDIKNLINISDIIVNPSLSEGMPRVILESLACRKPVIATNVGGTPELIKNKKTGILVRAKNSDDLKDAVNLLLNDENLRENISNNGYYFVRNKFQWKKIAKETLKFYLYIINN
ncbi:MAG: glycosyltransferase family 4 protein [Candidatus Helarchaeota archaeon]